MQQNKNGSVSGAFARQITARKKTLNVNSANLSARRRKRLGLRDRCHVVLRVCALAVSAVSASEPHLLILATKACSSSESGRMGCSAENGGQPEETWTGPSEKRLQTWNASPPKALRSP